MLFPLFFSSMSNPDATTYVDSLFVDSSSDIHKSLPKLNLDSPTDPYFCSSCFSRKDVTKKYDVIENPIDSRCVICNCDLSTKINKILSSNIIYKENDAIVLGSDGIVISSHVGPDIIRGSQREKSDLNVVSEENKDSTMSRLKTTETKCLDDTVDRNNLDINKNDKTANSKKYSFERDYNRVNKITKENIDPATGRIKIETGSHAEKLKFPNTNEVYSKDVSKEKRTRLVLSGQSFESDTEDQYPSKFHYVDKANKGEYEYNNPKYVEVPSRGLNDISNSYDSSSGSSRYKRYVFNSNDFPSIEEYPDGMDEPVQSDADNFVKNLSFETAINLESGTPLDRLDPSSVDFLNPPSTNGFVCSDYGHSSASNASSIQHQHQSDSVKRGTFSRSLSNADVPSDDNGKSVGELTRKKTLMKPINMYVVR